MVKLANKYNALVALLGVMLSFGVPVTLASSAVNFPTSNNLVKIMEYEDYELYVNGLESARGGRIDIALELLGPLASSGIVDAQAALGMSLLSSGNPGLKTDGLRWLEQAAESNDERSQLYLSELYGSGLLVKKNSELENYWLLRAINSGSQIAQNILMQRSSNDLESVIVAIEERDYQKAERILVPLAHAGLMGAQEILASLYEKGLLGKDKTERARIWFSKAASRGSRVAKYALAVSMLPKNDADTVNEAAANLLFQSAEPGYAEAQFRLGVLNTSGKIEDTQGNRGVHWYRLAAEQGHAEAQYTLGVRYLLGRDTEKSEHEAHNWFKRAAEQGHKKAQRNLSLSYKHGIGTEKSPEQASTWLKRSKQKTSKDSDTVNLATLKSPMFISDNFFSLESASEKQEPKQAPSDTANWFDKLPENGFTLQLSSSLKKSSALALSKKLGLEEEQTHIYKLKIRETMWFVLQYGFFLSKDDARQARTALRKKDKSISPVIRKVSSVRNTIALSGL